MIRSRLFSSISLAALSAGTAFAADMPVKAPGNKAAAVAPAPHNWTGFYVGGNAGYLRGQDIANGVTLDESLSAPKLNYTEIIAGGQAGFNFQSGRLVAGIEADINAGLGNGGTAYFNYLYVGPAVNNAAITSIATLRARGGLAFDRVLLYATGGFGWAKIKNDIPDTNPFYSFIQTSWRQGYVWGGGVEVALNNNWSVKAEALKLDVATKRVPDSVNQSGYRFDFDDSAVIVRGGINYKF